MSTETSSSPFDFPIDILRCIVEFAVWNDTKTAQSLEQVNCAFRIWAGPAAYRTVLLCSPSTLIGFSELLRAAPAPSLVHATAITRDTEFYAKSVKYLGIFKPKVPESVLDPIFSICTGVFTLELDNVTFRRFEACAMRPQEFIHVANSWNPSIFENLTHMWTNLNIIALASPPLPPRLKYLQVLVGMDAPSNNDWLFTSLRIPILLQSLPKLEVLVLSFFSSRRSTRSPPSPHIYWNSYLNGIQDERIVTRNSFMYAPESESTVALGLGLSIWELALLDGHRHPAFAGSVLTPVNYS